MPNFLSAFYKTIATILTTKGDIMSFSTTEGRLAVGTNGQVLTADSGETLGVKWDTAPADVVMTTKGDLVSFSTVRARLAVGSNTEILTADSGETLGIKWAAAAGLTLGAETSTTPISDDALTTNEGLISFTDTDILGSVGELILITAIEWKNSTTIDGNVWGSVVITDGDVPSAAQYVAVATSPTTAQSGSGVVQKVSCDRSVIIKGGTHVMGGIQSSSATATFRKVTGATQNRQKNKGVEPFPLWFNDTAWTSTAVELYIKIYFRVVS